MIKIINATNNIEDVYENNHFSLVKWKKYIDKITSNKDVFIDDMNETIGTGNYTYEADYLPILDNVIKNKEKVFEVIKSFNEVTNDLESKIKNEFEKSIDVTIVLYLGLCNGAGWVMELDKKQYIFLGIEKIIELNWYGLKDMYGLIYHELGHIYQMQYGILERDYKTSREKYLWQLFTEGIAMYFEQRIVNDELFFHQDNGEWLSWCLKNENQIILDFDNDIDDMKKDNQRYFGDWINYREHSDVGYFLGARFINYISKDYSLDVIINFDIDKVILLWNEFKSKNKKYI